MPKAERDFMRRWGRLAKQPRQRVIDRENRTDGQRPRQIESEILTVVLIRAPSMLGLSFQPGALDGFRRMVPARRDRERRRQAGACLPTPD